MLWELEKVFIEIGLENYLNRKQNGKHQKLFINVSLQNIIKPELKRIIEYYNLEKYSLKYEDIVIEIIEKYDFDMTDEIINSLKYFKNKGCSVAIDNQIRKYNQADEFRYNIATTNIGRISKKQIIIKTDMLVSEVDEIFKRYEDLSEICVSQNNVVKGIVTRNSFYSKLGWKYGYSIYSSKKITTIMNKEFLIVDYYTPIDKVINLAMLRNNKTLYDNVTVKKDGIYYGTVSVRDLLEKTIVIEVNNARHSNPLTGFPGNLIIEQKLERCILSAKKYYILYFDIDNFKPFNDVYGFENGDRIMEVIT